MSLWTIVIVFCNNSAWISILPYQGIFRMRIQSDIFLLHCTGCKCGPDVPEGERCACGPNCKCGDSCVGKKKDEGCKTCESKYMCEEDYFHGYINHS